MKTDVKRVREDEVTRTLSCMECEGQYRFDRNHMYIGKTSIRLVCYECGQKHSILITAGGENEKPTI